ncbi:MAG: hypothetical protein P0S95_02990 [Rhabdochlamydiaceae bacterium]|nr:hypothetical protein [Candidatus Amphrikana amoebophyrae]
MRLGEAQPIVSVREKRQKIANELQLVRMKKKGCKARNIDQCDLQFLHEQIEALDSQIEDKAALLNSTFLVQKKVKIVQTKVIVKDEIA